MVGGDRLGDVLQHHGLTHARRGDDQTALALTQGRDNVDHAAGPVFQGRILNFHGQALVRIERRQIVEVHLVAHIFRVLEIDRVDL